MLREIIDAFANVHYATYLLTTMTLVVVGVGVDLLTGIRKAKMKRERITSLGLRRTVIKLFEYWGLILMSFTLDLLLLITPIGEPWVTMACGLSVVLIEVKSVVENLKESRSKAAEVSELLQKIIMASDNEQAQKIMEAIKNL